MPWYNGEFPLSYKNLSLPIRKKAVEIANALLEEGAEEGIAIATGLKRAREHFAGNAKKTAKEVRKRGNNDKKRK